MRRGALLALPLAPLTGLDPPRTGAGTAGQPVRAFFNFPSPQRMEVKINVRGSGRAERGKSPLFKQSGDRGWAAAEGEICLVGMAAAAGRVDVLVESAR